MPHQTSSARNDYERKINYDWPKTKKIIFLKVTITIIGENTSIKCLQCIKYDN